jgi:predicted porin
MKKHLIAAAVAAAFAVPAMAQVTVSGTISTGIVDSGAAGAKAVVGSFGGGANAININATEDLGGGLSAGFTSQMRFNAQTGDVNSAGGANTDKALFHVANVFIGGGFGTVRVGRVAEDSNCGFDPWGCLTGAGSLVTGGSTAFLTGANTIANGFAYNTPTIAGFSAGFQTTINRVTEERQIFRVGYSAGPIAAQYLRVEGSRADIAQPADMTVAANAGTTGGTKALQHSVGLSYNFGVARVIYNWYETENSAGVVTNTVNNLSAVVPVGAMAIWASFAENRKVAADDSSWALGVNYPLSKRTSIGADVFEKGAAGASTGFALRARHTF